VKFLGVFLEFLGVFLKFALGDGLVGIILCFHMQ